MPCGIMLGYFWYSRIRRGGLGADFVNDKAILAQTDGALLQSIFEGKGRMPAWKNLLSVEQALFVIDYIRLSFGEK